MADATHPGTFLVEHSWPPVTPAHFEVAAERVRAGEDELAREGCRVPPAVEMRGQER